MKAKILGLLAIGLMATALAGCETARESSASAADSCRAQGLRPGSKAYAHCYHDTYQENREDARSQDSAVTAGVVAGVVGGAIVAADRPRYGYGYYGCRWNCY